jgi:hypothetical protein
MVGWLPIILLEKSSPQCVTRVTSPKRSVTSLTGYFAVLKGPEDIRMVYDASKSGPNKALWAPNFSLPTKEDMLNGVSPTSWMGDLNVGDIF